MKKIIIAISIAILIPVLIFTFLFFKNKKSENKQPPIADYQKKSERIIDDKNTLIKSQSSYEIIGSSYNNKNGFMIFIKNSDFEKTRQEAEEYLLKTLEITKDEACLLDVAVVVSPDVDENLNDNYGLSFCPNAKPIK
jgi:hypothetical protein